MQKSSAPAPAPVVIVGAGLAGLATAVAAAGRGHAVTVLEKASQAGGAASFSGGQVWVAANHVEEALGIEDNLADGEAYIRALARSHPELLDEPTMHRWLTTAPRAARYFEDLGAVRWDVIPDYPDYYQEQPGARPRGRYLTASFPREALADWSDRLRMTPHFPLGTTYADLMGAGKRASAFGASTDEQPAAPELLTFGTGVVAGFLMAAVERGVTIRLEHEVTELVLEGDRVVGALANGPDGASQQFDGAVVLATSGFDWDPELAQRYFGVEPHDHGSVAPRTLGGDGLRLATQAGGAVIEFPANRVPMLPGYVDGREPGFAALREHSLPHSFIVDASGRRFADDSVYWEVVKHALDADNPHMPCWMVWDEQHHNKYGLGLTPAGAPYPGDLVVQAGTLAELGEKLGIDGAALEQTATRFNVGAEVGKDPDFGRGSNQTWQRFMGDSDQHPNPLIGPVKQAPFYALRLRFVSTGIGLTGIAVDPDGCVVDDAAHVVPGLYAVGGAAAFTSSGTGYNSGFSLSRAITFGLLVAERLQSDSLEGTDRPAISTSPTA